MLIRTLIILIALEVCRTAGAQQVDVAIAEERMKGITPDRFDLVVFFEEKQVSSVQRRMMPADFPDKLADEPEIRISRYLLRWIKTDDAEFYHGISASYDGTSFRISGNSAILNKGDVSRQVSFKIGQWKEDFLSQTEFVPTIDRIAKKSPIKVPRNFVPMLEVAPFKRTLLRKDLQWSSIADRLVADLSKEDRSQKLMISPSDFLPLEFVQEFPNEKVAVKKFHYAEVELGGRTVLFPMLSTLVQKFEGETFMEVTSRVISISDPPELQLDENGPVNDWILPQAAKGSLMESPRLP